MWFLPLSLAVAGVAWALGGAARAVAVLVVATPCPLILAAPVALGSGLSAAARRGIVVKNGGVLSAWPGAPPCCWTRPGRSRREPAVTAVVPAGALAPEEILGLAASLDQASGTSWRPRSSARRPSAAAARPARGRDRAAGQGIEGTVAGRLVRLGRAEWAGVQGTPPWVRAVRRRAWLTARSRVRRRRRNPRARCARGPDPAGRPADDQGAAPRRHYPDRARHRRPGRGGQRRRRADRVDEVLAELTPGGKLDAVRREQRRAAVIMTGDGINDAPALALADVGVAMGRGIHRLVGGRRRGADRRSPRPPR